MAIKQRLPKVENGYELGADRYGYFSIIQPETYTINYIKNPVFYTNDPHSSYKARGVIDTPCDYWYEYINAYAQPKDRDFSIYGAGAMVIPSDSFEPSCTIYYPINLQAGTYTFSAYYSGGVDHEFLLQVTNTSGTIQYGETASNYGSGLNSFQRLHVTFTIPTQMNLELKLTELADSTGQLSLFYTDMWQCEDKPYMTHHFIGHSQFHTHDSNPGAYSWWGVPYFSESVRTDKAYESGKIIDLSELGFKLTGIAGLGVNPINTVVTPVASGGGVFEGMTNAPRTFTLIGRFYGKDLQDILTKRRDLYELIRPNGRNTYDQPTTLMFRIWDCGKKSWSGQPLFIYCRYVSGLEGALDSETSEDITITFTSEDPHIYSSYLKSYDIDPIATHSQLETDTGHVSPIFMLRDSDGVWTQLDMCLADPTGLGKHDDLCIVENILPDGTGGYYVYGTFNTVIYKGVTTTVNKIFRYNKITDSISALGTTATKGVTDGEIHKVIVTPNSDAFAVGSFTSAGGIANTNCIAKYNPGSNTWSSVSSGITGLGSQAPEIFDVEYGDDNRIYVSGKFLSIGGLGTLPIEGIARMRCSDNTWSVLHIARTMYVNYDDGIRLIRTFRRGKDIGYTSGIMRGFISGHMFQSLGDPNTMGTVYWDGTEVFYTNYRHDGYDNGPWPNNPMLAAFRGVIDNSQGDFYFIDGNDKEIYKLHFVMPAHTKNDWHYDPITDLYPQFNTVYTHPERNSPSIYHRMNPPFCRNVRVYWDGEWHEVPFSNLRFSELKIINNCLVTSPNFNYGLDVYELGGSGTAPEHNIVPTVWYFPLWKGNLGKFSYLDIYSSQQAYSAAFDIKFDTMEAFIAVNPGHIFPQKAGDNYISAVTPIVKVITNNGENTPIHFRITGPASLETFTNRTTEQTIRIDGYFVSAFDRADIVTIPTNGSNLGEWMHGHILDTSNMNMRLVPGKNIIYCKVNDITLDTTIKLIFREKYASIEKAIEYIGG